MCSVKARLRRLRRLQVLTPGSFSRECSMRIGHRIRMQTDCATDHTEEHAALAARRAAFLRFFNFRFWPMHVLILALLGSGLFLSAQSKPAQSKPTQSSGKTVRH